MRKMVLAVVVTNLLTVFILITASNLEAHMQLQKMDSVPKCQQQMMGKLGKADKDYDLRFINTMIPHHEGAVKMAKDALQKSQHQEIKTMAHNIIESQEKEIAQLKAWRKDWYDK